jgi:hypothetical protein
MSIADWIMAEAVRIHCGSNPEETQRMVDGLVQRKIPLVFDTNGLSRILNPRLSSHEQTLLLLARIYPLGMKDAALFKSVGHSNSASSRMVL